MTQDAMPPVACENCLDKLELAPKGWRSIRPRFNPYFCLSKASRGTHQHVPVPLEQLGAWLQKGRRDG